MGRRGLPTEWIDQIAADYLRLRSTTKVAALHGRKRQAIWEILHRRGLNKYPKRLREFRDFNGRRYYRSGKGGAFRLGKPPRTFLHHDIWRAERGEIPPGHQITFRDGDKENMAIENLLCLAAEAMRARFRTGNNGSTKAQAAQRIEENMGWIIRQAHKYHAWHGADLDDLIQQGRLAVAKASRTYKKDRGAKFLTWASFEIRAQMQRWCHSRHELIRRPQTERGRAAQLNVVSIHAPLDEERTMEDLLLREDETVTAAADAGDRRALVRRALQRLTARERNIILWRFADELTLEECAARLGLSRERIRQIEFMALRKLRRSRLIKKAA